MRIAAVGPPPAVAAAEQTGDLDPRRHHRGGGDGAGGGGGGGGAQQETDEQHHHHHHLLQVHQQVQDQEQQPVFQLQHLQAAAAVRQQQQRGLSVSSAEYALLAPMGDAGHHHHGFQPQLLSFAQHPLHQFTAQATATGTASHSRSRAAAAATEGGASGEVVPATSHSRVRSTGGEIVAVQGGHIVRSTGRKDRHSKVCTARGPRDRRVRLSAHTAIQFYDVQDRLGYDRPSKAVDWLIKNAKDAIDKLEVLPAWQPTATNAAAAAPSSSTHPADSAENSDDQAQAITVAHAGFDFPGGAAGGSSSGGGAGFLPASLDSDSIADTIKSFFPMGGTGGGEASSSAAAAHSSAMGFQNYTPDLLSRTGSHSQELRLSLQPLPDPMFQHQQEHDRSHGHGGNGSAQQHQALFPGAAGYTFGGGTMWAEQQAAQSQRMVPWNMPDPGGGGGYLFNVSQQAAHMQAALGGQSQFLFQRGPLQSSNQPSDRGGWPETTVEPDNPMHHHHQAAGLGSAVSAVGFGPGIGGFSGFRIPGRIQGEEEHNGGGGNGDKPPPSSVSSASHH